MAKRFTDTEKWKDPWFRTLPPNSKVLWFFLTENCDSAGFWKKDYELATFFCGFEVTEKYLLAAFNRGKKRLNNYATHMELREFVSFQYGRLSNECRPHKPIIELLSKYLQKGYLKGINTLEEQEQVKEQDNNNLILIRDEDVTKEKDKKKWFEELWLKYPSKTGKLRALASFTSSVKTEGNLHEIREALKRYLEHLQVNTWKSAQDGSTWFNSWRDWVDFVEPERRETSEQRDARILDEIKSAK